jgi:hypothetical protein
MFNFFEQPWTLFISAAVILYAIFRFRSIFPKKRLWWQWLIPPFIAVIAFGLDYFIQTDFEKINTLINTGIKAVEEENISVIEAIVSANYKDSFHYSREQLRSHCERELSQSLVEENKKVSVQLEISPPTATADLTVVVKFEKDSYVAQSYKQSLITRVKLYLQKESVRPRSPLGEAEGPDGQNKKWFINRIELLAIDNQPVSWREIRE